MEKLVNRKKIRTMRKKKFWRRRQASGLSKPRLCIFRSSKHIQAQIFDDERMVVLASASSAERTFTKKSLPGKEIAKIIGTTVAERAKKNGVSSVVFDKNGFSYHGRVMALAESARSAGLDF